MSRGNSARAYAQTITPDAANRHADDFYTTDGGALSALLSVERFPGAIWEPACGDGAIGKVLERAGYDVVATDLHDRGYGLAGVDFFQAARPKRSVRSIITNPPFKFDDEFVLRAVTLRGIDKVALFLRLQWLEGFGRHRDIFREHPPARVWVFRLRPPVRRGGTGRAGGPLAFAWYVWERGARDAPRLGWL